ncbi:hypothetical protein KSP39_PZI000150 [Platanthera zijinensis]|uniref:UVR domain-containing protein n=1 Tax=Platanthera zijinensis TaxID=2320716 RepID=A0AAP0C4I0_9ASPA
MAAEFGGDGELDCSLFEGMILFSPSDLLPTDLPPEKEPDAPYPSQDPTQPTQQNPHPPSPSIPTASSAGSSTSPHTKSQPLDENLFSNLALKIPIEPEDTLSLISAYIPNPPPVAPSRQISRRKKRALRIGYARETIDLTPAISVDDPTHLSEDAASTISSDSTPSTAGRNEELLDRSVHEEVESAQVVIASAVNGEGDAEVHLSTSNASEEDDRLGLFEEKLKLLRSEVYAKLERIGETATSVYFERKELGRRRRKAGQDVNQAESAYRELEKQLEEACEEEEFERAERVSESLAAVEKDKDRLQGTLRDMEFEGDSVDSRMQNVLESQIAAEEEGVKLLEQFAKDAVDQADLIYRNAEELSSKELEDWQTSMELLEMNRLEIDIKAELISDARSGLDCSIEELVKDDREEIEVLMKKRLALAKELEDLLRLVSLKESEIAENESQIQADEEKMSRVVFEFQKTSSSVGMKHDGLKSEMSRIDSERARLSSKRNEIEEFISLAGRKCSTLKGLASVALSEAKTCQGLVVLRKDLASSILESREDKVQLVRTEKKVLEEIQILREQISHARTTVQELSSNRVSIQRDIDSFKQRITSADKRGPELEAEKKVAAAARNFKEAGRIAAEAKALNLEKESLQRELVQATLDLEQLDLDIKHTICVMQDSEELVSLKEKEAAVASFERLRLLAAAARAERSAALELGDSEEGDFLLKEAEAAEERARQLQEAYSLDPIDCPKTRKSFAPAALIAKLAGRSLAEMTVSLKQLVADE